MKNKLLMSLGLLLIAALGVSVAKLEMTKTKETLTAKIERWQSLNRDELLSKLQNDQGMYLNSVSLTREDLQAILDDPNRQKVDFHLAVNQNGKFQFVLTREIESFNTAYGTEVEALRTASASSDKTANDQNTISMKPEAKEHLMDIGLAVEEIEKWQKATPTERLNALYTKEGERLRSFSFNKAVFGQLLQHKELASATSFIALNEDMKLRFITIGRNTQGGLILPQANSTGEVGFIFQYIHPCPSTCNVCPGGMEQGPGGLCVEIDKSQSL